MNPLADRVRVERLARKWSVRRAANESGGLMSNTWWAKFEDGIQPLTEGIRQGVATAFGWDPDWPDATPADPTSRKMDELDRRMAALEARLPPAPPVATASPEVVRNARKPRAAHTE